MVMRIVHGIQTNVKTKHAELFSSTTYGYNSLTQKKL